MVTKHPLFYFSLSLTPPPTHSDRIHYAYVYKIKQFFYTFYPHYLKLTNQKQAIHHKALSWIVHWIKRNKNTNSDMCTQWQHMQESYMFIKYLGIWDQYHLEYLHHRWMVSVPQAENCAPVLCMWSPGTNCKKKADYARSQYPVL